MKKNLILTFIFVVLLFSYNNVEAKTLNLKETISFNPIYPVEENVIGIKVKFNYDKLNLYSSKVYGFETSKSHYDFGGEYFIKNNLSFDLRYSYWLENNISDYSEKKGINLEFNYKKNWEEYLSLFIFSGEIAKSDQNKSTKIDYINLNYNKELYYDWHNKLLINLELNCGQVKSTGDDFNSAKLKFPYKRESFTLVPSFGYINNGKGIDLSYDLQKVVKGYSINKKGNKFFKLKAEKSFDILRQSNFPVLKFFDFVPFVNIGEVWDDKESYSLKSSAGLGLALEAGGLNFRFDNIVDDRKEKSFIFNIEKSY